VEAPATPEQKAKLARLSPEQITGDMLAGAPITQRLVRAPGNDAPIGGIKLVSDSGWAAARPSGTEAIYKIYAESFRDPQHLRELLAQAQAIVDRALQ
jgi:phosphoglucomutase